MTFMATIYVFDRSSKDPVEGASVECTITVGGFAVLISGWTDSYGNFTHDYEHEGLYHVIVEKDGYHTWEGNKIIAEKPPYNNPLISLKPIAPEPPPPPPPPPIPPPIVTEDGRLQIPRPTSFLPDWTWKDWALVIGSFGAYLLFKDELKGGKR